MLQKDLDVFQMIHVRFGYWIITTFDVAVIGRQIQRCPVAFVGEIHIGAVIQKIRSQFVVAILRRDQQGTPAITRNLVDVCTRG